jgi:hypothetical protein
MGHECKDPGKESITLISLNTSALGVVLLLMENLDLTWILDFFLLSR